MIPLGDRLHPRAPVCLALAAVGCWYQPPDGIVRADEVPLAPNDLGGAAFVACVDDGDTVDLFRCDDEGTPVRLLGINAPEIAHAPDPAECWGPEASDFLAQILLGREVVVTYDGGPQQDLYGRTLAYLWAIDDTLESMSTLPGVNEVLEFDSELAESGKALLINEYLASQGWARVYDAEAFGERKYQARLEAAQADAQSGGRGLWGQCADTVALPLPEEAP